jgi:hypothetical protein
MADGRKLRAGQTGRFLPLVDATGNVPSVPVNPVLRIPRDADQRSELMSITIPK